MTPNENEAMMEMRQLLEESALKIISIDEQSYLVKDINDLLAKYTETDLMKMRMGNITTDNLEVRWTNKDGERVSCTLSDAQTHVILAAVMMHDELKANVEKHDCTPEENHCSAHQTPAQIMVARFGGVRAASRCIGVSASAVSRWKQRGFIPSDQQARVLDAAAAAGIELSTSDIVRGL